MAFFSRSSLAAAGMGRIHFRSMCRLFGSRSLQPGGVAHELLRGSNALRTQSREHPDGWGLAWFVGGMPQVARSLAPAHADDDFETISEFVEAQTVVAHIRKASVGRVALENTHPFQRGRWLFAHNGTLPSWEDCRGPLEALLDPVLRACLLGETDSERCFFLFLTRLARRCDPEEADFGSAAAALSDAVADIRRICAGATVAASTTFLATDGRSMVACRRGRTLHMSAPTPDASGRVPWFAVSSEDPTGSKAEAGHRRARWQEIPEDTLVGVDGELRLHRASLQAAAAA